MVAVMALDNSVLILGDRRYEAHITRRKLRNGPYYYAATLHVRGGQGEAIPATQWACYDAAQAHLLAEAAKLLEEEAQ